MNAEPGVSSFPNLLYGASPCNTGVFWEKSQNDLQFVPTNIQIIN